MANATDPALVIDGLKTHFFTKAGVVKAVDGVSFNLKPGETLGVVGESGCGKSVLLKSIIGLIKPTSGHVLFEDKDLSKLDERELTKQRIRFGYVFQNAALFDSLTVGQNVAFPLRQHKRYRDREIQDMVLSRLAEVGLPDGVVTKKPAELSGGMRKRVGLARALIMSPELMLYDEPTTGLDPIMSDVINELMMRTRNQHTVTSIIVTHDMHTVRKVADRVVMLCPFPRLAEGTPQIIFDGAPSQIDRFEDQRVLQFVRGEAGERLMEMRAEQNNN